MATQRAFTIILFLLVTTSALPGQVGHALRVIGASGPSGATCEGSVTIDTQTELVGWNFSLCTTPGELRILSTMDGSALSMTLNGSDPDFVISDIDEAGAGLTYALILNGFGPLPLALPPLSPGSDLEILRLLVRLDGPPGSTAPMAICDLGNIPNPPLFVPPGGSQEFTPVTQDGTFTISAAASATLRGGETTASGLQALLPILLTLEGSDGVKGLSFGLALDPTKLMAQSLEVGAALQAISGGTGPQFFLPNLEPIGGGGVTLAVIMGTNPTPALLSPGVDLEIAQLAVNIALGAVGEAVPVSFSSLLGDPPVATEIEVSGPQGDLLLEPQVAPGLIHVPPPRFRRGDANGDGLFNLMDAIDLLESIFLSPTPPSCGDRLDVNDDGALGILDAVAFLTWLYLNGPPPGSPHLDCGEDPTPDILGCNPAGSSCP